MTHPNIPVKLGVRLIVFPRAVTPAFSKLARRVWMRVAEAVRSTTSTPHSIRVLVLATFWWRTSAQTGHLSS